MTTTVEGRERFPVQGGYAREFRDSPEAIGRLLVSSRDEMQVPLAQVADIDIAAGAPMIRSENGYLNDLVSIDVRGRDVGGYVTDAKQVVARTMGRGGATAAALLWRRPERYFNRGETSAAERK